MTAHEERKFTALGLFPVILWGISVAFIRHIQDQIGMLAALGFIYAVAGSFGLCWQLAQHRKVLSAPFRSRYLYLRWFFFVTHTSLLMCAIANVSRAHLPFVILLNYLWPTFIILSAIRLAGAKITRKTPFVVGCTLVISSLVFEIVGPHGINRELFLDARDCTAYALAFTGAVSWGFYSAFSRAGGIESGGSSTVWLFQLTVALSLLITALPGDHSTWNLPASDWYLLLMYCLAQFFAFLCWDLGMRKGSIVVLSLFADFIPFISLLTTNIVLDVEVPTKTILAVAILVLGAVTTRFATMAKKAILVPDDGI